MLNGGSVAFACLQWPSILFVSLGNLLSQVSFFSLKNIYIPILCNLSLQANHQPFSMLLKILWNTWSWLLRLSVKLRLPDWSNCSPTTPKESSSLPRFLTYWTNLWSLTRTTQLVMFNYYVSYFLVKDVPITEESRVIPPNTLFSILGSTQLSNVAKIIARMDHGHGLVDRFLIATPLAYRPTLTEMETASDHLSTEVVENFEKWFKNIYEQHTVHFSFRKPLSNCSERT